MTRLTLRSPESLKLRDDLSIIFKKRQNMDFYKFWRTLIGYRESDIYILIGKTKVVDRIKDHGKQGISAEGICRELNWDKKFGKRFLECMVSMEILNCHDGLFSNTKFSEKFFSEDSENYQGKSLKFERDLIDSWKTLEDTLISGKRIYNSGGKSETEYRKSLKAYIGAMDEAASVRAGELIHTINIKDRGTIADFGAGSGAFLKQFLKKNKKWNGIYCDLHDVVQLTKSSPWAESFNERISYCDANILVDTLGEQFKKIDIALLSNIIHCYCWEDNRKIFKKISKILSKNSILIIHDFFKDLSKEATLYDLHMMVNTFNGMVYSSQEIIGSLKEFGFEFSVVYGLPSKSGVIIAKK